MAVHPGSIRCAIARIAVSQSVLRCSGSLPGASRAVLINGRKRDGFTLVELMLVVGLVGVLAMIAVPSYSDYVDRAKAARAISDIRAMSITIGGLPTVDRGKPLPETLAEVGLGSMRDPWGNPYQYLKLAGEEGKGGARKDKLLKPLNSDFDLYSLGRDGESVATLSAKVSRDDIVRAADGAFIGLASDFDH